MDKFEYKKSIGQNFMRDENIINKIVDSAGIDKDTLVIEIGPGAGSLSKKIIPLSGYSILYEIDTRLESVLDRELSGNDNYKIIHTYLYSELQQHIVIRVNFTFRILCKTRVRQQTLLSCLCK